MKIIVYNQQGEKVKELDAPAEFFDVPFKPALVHRALLRQLANRRAPYAHVKTKSEVRGGGKKPWAQKGTGRARQGSTRNPHWRGGGVAHGPRNDRNYHEDMPRKERRLAIFSALSEKLRSNQVLALDQYDGAAKTKTFAAMIKRLPLPKDVLLVLPEKSETILRASRNLPIVKPLLVNYLNIDDLRKYEHVLFLEPAIAKMKEIFSSR